MNRAAHGCTAINGSLRMYCRSWKPRKHGATTRERLTANIASWTDDIGRADQRRANQREKANAAMEKAAGDLAHTARPSSPTRMPSPWPPTCKGSGYISTLTGSTSFSSCWPCSASSAAGVWRWRSAWRWATAFGQAGVHSQRQRAFVQGFTVLLTMLGTRVNDRVASPCRMGAMSVNSRVDDPHEHGFYQALFERAGSLRKSTGDVHDVRLVQEPV